MIHPFLLTVGVIFILGIIAYLFGYLVSKGFMDGVNKFFTNQLNTFKNEEQKEK